jgi:Ca2+-binding EF-hand superfamily protein
MNRTTRFGILAGTALLAAGVLAAPASAQRGGFAMGEAFARADANNDNRVSREESQAWLAGRFAQMDANRDGGVTIEEFRAWAQSQRGNRPQPPQEAQQRMEQRGQAMFRMLDANADGRVTLDEVRPFLDAMFRARDADSDGQITREELTAGMRGRGGPGGYHHHGMGRGPGQPPAQQN